MKKSPERGLGLQSDRYDGYTRYFVAMFGCPMALCMLETCHAQHFFGWGTA